MESVHTNKQACCGDEVNMHKAVASHCCCHGPSRHFITKAERKEALEQYKDQLQKELTGVEEHLQELG